MSPMYYEIGDEFIGDEDDYDIGADDIEAILSGYEIGALPGWLKKAGRMAGKALDPRTALRAAYDPMGAARGVLAARRTGGNTAMARAVAMKRAENGSLLREVNPTKSREYPLGLDSVAAVAAAAAFTITVQPQVVFRPTRLSIPPTIAPSFIITNFQVGKNPQFAAAGNIPAESFTPDTLAYLKCDTANLGSTITLQGQNVGLAAVRFLATLFGEAVE